MDEKILSYLKTLKRRKTVTLGELEKLFSGDKEYEDFAKEINKLVQMDILKEVKKHGTNHKIIPLANTYRLNKYALKKVFIDEIQNMQLKISPHINLTVYLSLTEKQWEKDLPYIEKIDAYLKEKGLPKSTATSQERSYYLVGDEKWIDEGGGKKLLERLELWDKLKINNVPDPLMLAVNPQNFSYSVHRHLIVENKATYYGLLEELKNTQFTSLIYGAGWKIVSGIEALEKQLGLEDSEHILYYFGDLDFEGISIWYALSNKKLVKLAIEFYTSLLQKDYSKGKENQAKNKEALNDFLAFFDKEDQEKIKDVLQNGGYYPQEGLNKEELREIWRKIL
ncbi:Wadjet anti-phage system protein JetD domain-containing protein [Caldisalinibacter kiritimatiensis]|uniref:Putative cytosolic Protein n=1 Tax=Caldisalinibacter kiritimatiensis TaxID=1304284 RepID=R1CU93_9FIRM|nr:Wadjet anti-phage system protein JetD domain-containing protein [Caldisalinibacter kiritimatiensis]EOD00249.1 Putative cytosolic Protein [Caldisalinibacter kiritimatiensis]